jgi:hypothetical protein
VTELQREIHELGEGEPCEVVDLRAVRRARSPQRQTLHASPTALHRYNDLARQIWQHESRQISAWEAWAVVHAPHRLGLGHGPLANINLNPARPRTPFGRPHGGPEAS